MVEESNENLIYNDENLRVGNLVNNENKIENGFKFYSSLVPNYRKSEYSTNKCTDRTDIKYYNNNVKSRIKSKTNIAAKLNYTITQIDRYNTSKEKYKNNYEHPIVHSISEKYKNYHKYSIVDSNSRNLPKIHPPTLTDKLFSYEHIHYLFVKWYDEVRATIQPKEDKRKIDKSWILLDIQSTMDLLFNPKFLKNIRQVDEKLVVRCDTGKIRTSLVGILPGYSTIWYYEDGIANILSLYRVSSTLHVQYDSHIADTFVVWESGGQEKISHQHQMVFINVVRNK